MRLGKLKSFSLVKILAWLLLIGAGGIVEGWQSAQAGTLTIVNNTPVPIGSYGTGGASNVLSRGSYALYPDPSGTAPGATYTTSYADGYVIYYYCSYTHGPQVQVAADGNGATIYLGNYWCGTPAAATTNYCTYSIRNSETYMRAFQLVDRISGVAVAGQGWSTFMTLRPGEVGTLRIATTNDCNRFGPYAYAGSWGYSVVGAGTNAYSWIMPTDATIPQGLISTNDYTTAGSQSGYITNAPPNSSDTLPPGSVYQQGTNAPIIFGTNETRSGFNAVYTAIANQTAVTESHLRGIANALASNNAALQEAFNGSNVSTVYLPGVTNLLEQIRNNQTNTWGRSNIFEMTGSGSAFSQLTNQAYMEGKIDAVMGDTKGRMEGIASAAGQGPPTAAGGGSGTIFTFEFMGKPFNMDPNTIFPGLPAIFRSVVSWVATFLTVAWMAKEYAGHCWAFSRAQLGGVPNVDSAIPFLGNALGVTIAVLVPVLYLGFTMTIWAFICGGDLDMVGKIGTVRSTNPFTVIGNHSPGALYLLQQFIDLYIILGLAWTRISFYFVGGKLVFVWAALSRFLPGK